MTDPSTLAEKKPTRVGPLRATLAHIRVSVPSANAMSYGATTRHVATRRPTMQNSLRTAFGAAQRIHHAPAMQSAPRSTVFVGGTPRRATFAHVGKSNEIATNMPTWQGRDTRPHVGPRWNVRRAAHPPLAKKVMSQSASHCIALHSAFHSRHVARRWRTCAGSFKIATTLPHWQGRNTLAHGGGRAICHNGRRMSTCGRMNRYFRETGKNRGQGEQKRY